MAVDNETGDVYFIEKDCITRIKLPLDPNKMFVYPFDNYSLMFLFYLNNILEDKTTTPDPEFGKYTILP